MTKEEKKKLYFEIAVKELRNRQYNPDILDRWLTWYDEFEDD